jgi:chromosome partitioning protein
MIITIASLKGGVGKSTVALNLAVTFSYMGNRVALIDTDTNESCRFWAADREEYNSQLPYVFVSSVSDGRQLTSILRGLTQNYDLIIIDGTPSLNETTSRIILACDLLIIPLKPGAMDIRATQKFIERYDQSVQLKGEDIPAYILLNQFREGLNISRKTVNLLEESNIEVLRSRLVLRTAYADSVELGLGVYEYSDLNAKQEIIDLTNEINAILAE